jgi:hypothetical protein
MLKRYSALVLLLVLQSTAASAQCWDSSSLKSARSANSKAATEYSTCLEDQARVENQVRVQSQARGENAARGENQASQYCKDEYSNLQSAKHDLETAPSQNTRVRARTVVSSRMAVFPFSARLRSPPGRSVVRRSVFPKTTDRRRKQWTEMQPTNSVGVQLTHQWPSY